MSPTAARWFALGTGFIAVVAVCVAALMGLRLHRTRAALVDLRRAEACAPAAGPEAAP